MTDRARIKINLSARELEIEGSESFVTSFGPRLEALLDGLGDPSFIDRAFVEPPAAPSPAPTAGPVQAPSAGSPALEGGIGEFLTRLPGSATDVDRMLAAGYWLQGRSGDDAFGTGEANRSLLEQGVKIGNPSQCVKQSLLARRVFIVQRGRFRVSQIGRQHLRQLMGAVVPA